MQPIDWPAEWAGFVLEAEETVEEIPALALRLVHRPTGARVLALLADDDNKVFAVAFRTPPASSNGLPHILEHSVLNGSRKYPLKEPFVELAKGSLNTFLNAMTYPDKTVYPVASRNEKDLWNLMDVYLDAVFFPNLKNDPMILKQEGWHYELRRPEDPLLIRGVVYNEMKGAYSSPESVLYQALQSALYPDTPYRFDAGGDPDVIPTLTQEEFVRFHDTYYHPSNAYFFFYGDLDLKAALKKLADDYLAAFGRRPAGAAPLRQMPFATAKTVRAPYAIPAGDDPTGKDFLAVGFAAHDALDVETALAFDILSYILLDSPAAPLKEALLRAGFGRDVFGLYEPALRQPLFAVVAKGARREDLERFDAAVREMLSRFAAAGLSPKLVEGAIARKEFQLREADFRGYPKGLVYLLSALTTWLYDGDPLAPLRWEPALETIKREAPHGYFERLLRTRLLANEHRVRLALEATPGLEEEKQAALEKSLAERKASLSEAEKAALVAETEALLRRQTTPDDPEALKAIPILSLDEVPKTVEPIPTAAETVAGTTLLVHALSTNGVAYGSLYFSLADVAPDDLPRASALSALLGRIGTRRRTYGELATALDLATGGFRASVETIERADGSGYTPYLVVRFKALRPKLPEALALVREILTESRFDDVRRVRELFDEQASRLEMSLYDRGHLVAAGRMLALFSPAARVRDLTGGIAYFHALKGWLKDERAFRDVVEGLDGLLHRTVRRAALLGSVTVDPDGAPAYRAAYAAFLEALPEGTPPRPAPPPEVGRLRSEGLLSAAKVQYVAKGYNFRALGYGYTGRLEVLRTLLTYDYLWNRVRVQGGAYGSFVTFDRSGNVAFASYRDPHLDETLAVFDEAPAFIERFSADGREMTKLILGTVSRLDRPLTPAMKGERGDYLYLAGLDEATLNAERAEILATTPEDIRRLAPLVRDVLAHGRIAVLGGSERLRAAGDRFDVLTRVTDD
ncbi:MAG: insulinase family protein [Hydrogenibacillus schlegelii]|uniref:Insulinase family protein n=1 Tax=Hydrogenibacillus schlegelii TaxID=1484 RepID=A0A947D0Z5_HYDSH|nr:insulinase family protein [Hydrogenibacillus schlegelii]